MSVDRSFLIDVQRERRRGNGPAHAWLTANSEVELLLSVVALGEFAEGFEARDDPLVVAMAEHHAAARRRRDGHTARQADVPILTANVEEFGRVPGVQVIEYRAA